MRLKASAVIMAAALATALDASAEDVVRAPLRCTRGLSDQGFVAEVTVPRDVPEGSTYALRIDGAPSGAISHVGLNYIHDMSTDYALPTGAIYVPGSAHFVPNTGKPQRASRRACLARWWSDPRRAPRPHRQWLELHAVQRRASAQGRSGRRGSPRDQVPAVRVTANVFLLGDLETTCDPIPKPLVIGTTLVAPASSSQ